MRIFLRPALAVFLLAPWSLQALTRDSFDENPAVDEGTPRVIVNGEAVRPSYNVPTAPTATKLDLPLRDLPQSIEVVPQALLEDRAVLRVEEAADNVPGVTATARNGGSDTPYFIIRGFGGSFGTTLRDGFREFSGYLPGGYDPQGLARVEFFKGPSSILYGNASSPGGTVNLVSKTALDVAGGEATFVTGSFDLYRTTLDVGGPLVGRQAEGTPPTLSYRLNVAYENAGSYRDDISHESEFVAPTLTWRPTTQDTLTLLALYGHLYGDFDPGFTPVKPLLDLPVSRNLGLPNFDRENADSGTVTAEYVHGFDHAGNWQLRSAFNTKQARVNEHQEYGDFLTGQFLSADGRELNQFAFEGPQFEHDYAWQNEVYGMFDTGPLKHHALVGVELSRYQYGERDSYAPVAPVNIDDPQPRPLPEPGSFLPILFQTVTAPGVGFYYQDLVELLPNLKLLHGGRFDWVQTRFDSTFPGDTSPDVVHTDFAYSPRVGLVYQPWAATSVYFNWSNSFQPQFFNPVSGGLQIPPETGEQYEIGARQEFFGGRLRAEAAVYQITKQNVLDPDPANPFLSIPSGEQRSRGVELNLVGSPLPGWQVVGTYALTDARVTEDDRPSVVDNRLVGAPIHSGGVWSRYELPDGRLRGLAFGAGVYLFGPREATLPNTFDLPGFTRVDLEVSYRLAGDHVRLQFNVKNLTDKKYFEANDQAYQFNPAAPRTFLGTVAVGF